MSTALKQQVRVGIDVGGTFTHAVALDARNAQLIAKVKVPTTHNAATGVGQGIVASLKELMSNGNLLPSDVVSVAHSTTQATNSLLEGDVETVGIVTLGRGVVGKIAAIAGQLGKIELAPQRYLKTVHRHIDLQANASSQLEEILTALRVQNIRVVVVGELFSPLSFENERVVAKTITAEGFMCVASADIAKLLGFKVRLRTAAINMSLLPKMLEVAEHTERGIRALGVTSPLMIMRSDGGVMSLEEMRKKPILTLLSGPAAGIAAALRYLKISDGVFLEVGGTSTDISVIRNGRAMVRTAVLGGRRLFLETLDCRTVGIGGGSMPRLSGTHLKDVGPRSAHIAGVGYAAFSDEVNLDNLVPTFVSPKPGDPNDYFVMQGQGTASLTFTPSCAANVLGLVPANDCAVARPLFLQNIIRFAERMGWGDIKTMSTNLLTLASDKVLATMLPFMKEYGLEKQFARIVGGGGGAASLVPFVANRAGMGFEIARDNDVISAIGAALGLIRVVVEQSVVNPSGEDIMRIRADAHRQTTEQGARPESVEVFIEVDAKKNIVRAEAQGSMEYTPASLKTNVLSKSELEIEVLKGINAVGFVVTQTLATESLSAFLLSRERATFFGRHTETVVVVTDNRGVVRLRVRSASVFVARASEAVTVYQKTMNERAHYGDGGVVYPFTFALKGERVIDLSKLGSPQLVAQILEIELRETNTQDTIVFVTSFETNDEN